MIRPSDRLKSDHESMTRYECGHKHRTAKSMALRSATIKLVQFYPQRIGVFDPEGRHLTPNLQRVLSALGEIRNAERFA